MNAPFVLVCEPQPDLVITPERYHEWRALADVRGHIVWNREGSVRVVSTDVLDNALCIFSDYTQMVACGRMVEMPKTATRIQWEQASAVDH